MDIYLTNLESKERWRFPMLPQEIRIDTGRQFYDFQVMYKGEVRLPSGAELDKISWSGILPGNARSPAAARGKTSYIQKQKDPQEAYKWIKGLKRTKIRLLVTETPININVYIESFTGKVSGGFGDINYNISFIQAKEIKLSAAAQNTTTPSADSGTRPEPPPAKTHTVVAGDTMWDIAQKYMGNGARYTELYEANKNVIDPINIQYSMPKYTIYPGQVFTIPN